MSKEVESRVVEMRFDNKSFKSGAKETLESLTKLKEALKFSDAGKGLENLDKAVSNVHLEGIQAGVEALTNRFSTFGIVGMRIVQNVTDALTNQLGKAISFVTDSIVSGGIKRAMNIENAHFQLQALLKDEAKVQAVMNDAMESVDGTAYAYDEAARAASQFAASGLEAGEEMLAALKGITGVAAMTNSEYEGISRIFTTVAGQGRLMGDQLLQLSSRGMNAASTIADWFREVQGQSQMTEAAVREMVSDGEISFKIFADAMTWAFGDSAKRANETFTGALSNMKSALARIGAGFISPLVEQNGELVGLFNALRIQINNVKGALVFDEQQSAISGLSKETQILSETIGKMTQNGTIGFDRLITSIVGITRSEEDLAGINERLQVTFDSVKETGYATSEMLNEFSNEGIEISHIITNYLNGVQHGSVKASESMRKAVREISGGTEILIKDVETLADEGKISADIFSASLANASKTLTKEAGFASEAITAMFKTVKDEGSLTMDHVKEFERNGMKTSKAIMDYMNGVSDGTIRASYATRTAIEEMTDGAMLSSQEINKFVEEGKISFDIFQSAMEHAYGDSHALSKQFTDSFLDMMKKIRTSIETADLTKPLEVFYYGIESTKNVGKALLSVLKPLGKAFGEVFFNMDSDKVLDLAQAIETLTAKMQLSEKNSQDLHDAFKGVFDVTKLLVDIFFKLVGAIVPINNPLADAGDGFLSLAGSLGRATSEMTEWFRKSKLAHSVLEEIRKGISKFVDTLEKWVDKAEEVTKSIKEWAHTDNIIGEMQTKLEGLASVQNPFARFIDKLYEFNAALKLVDWKNPTELLNRLGEAFQKFSDKAMQNEGFAIFVENMKKYGIDLSKALTWDTVLEKMETIQEKFSAFISWMKETVGPFFENFSFGNAVGTVGGLGIIYAMIKASKSIEGLVKIGDSIPKVLNSVTETLKSYQHSLDASAIIKIAGAIAILAAALTILSFADTEHLMSAVIALGVIGALLVVGLNQFKKAMDSLKELRPVKKAIDQFASGLSKSMTQLSKAVKWRAIGKSIKDMAISLGIVVVAIAGLGYLWTKHQAMMEKGLQLAGVISSYMAAFMIVMSLISEFGTGEGMKNFAAGAAGMVALSISIHLVISAMNRVFEMEFPSDWKMKLGILAGIIAGMSGIAIVLGAASRIAGEGKLKTSAFLGIAALLVTTVYSLDKLFKMEIPDDWGKKLGILAALFVGISGLMVVMGAAAKLSGGGMKAAGTILAMTAFLAVTVGSLMLLSIIPGDKLLKGAIALSAVLASLALGLAGAAKIVKGDAPKTVLSMAIMLGTITASLAVLAMIPAEQLLKAAVAIGAILLSLGYTFKQVGTITDPKANDNMMLMILTMIGIAAALYKLSSQPWDGMLAAGVSMSAVMYTFGEVLKKVSAMKGIKTEKIGLFLLATLALVPIGYELEKLSAQPWQGLLAAGAAMSAVLLSFGQVLQQVSAMKGLKIEKIGLLLLATVAIIPIGYALENLASLPWQGLLGSGTAISEVLLSLGATLAIISALKGLDPVKIALFVASATAVVLIADPIQQLAQNDWKSLLGAATALSEVLLAMSVTLAICSAVGSAAGPAAIGIGLLDLFIADLTLVLLALGKLYQNPDIQALLNGGLEMMSKLGQGLGNFVGGIAQGIMNGISAGLEQMGASLSAFMTNLQPFIEGAKNVDESVLAGCGYLFGAIALITGAEIISAIGMIAGGGLGLVNMALELETFAQHLPTFIDAVNQVKPETVEACKGVASMILAITAANVISGITQFFGLSSSLDEFGMQLEKFGKHMSKFAVSVEGIKPEQVEGAASAAQMMAKVANNLPPQGGLAALIFGEHSLEEFGKELVPFGVQMRLFAWEVKNLKPEAVTGAAMAAQIMSNVANNLPPQGGLQAVIFGEHSLESFGKELVAFGLQMKLFSWEVKDMDPSVIRGVSTITTIMTNLSNNLPDNETLWQKIFGGGQMTLSDFGKELSSFAKEVRVFTNVAAAIDIAATYALIDLIKDLLSLVDTIGDTSTSGFQDFISGLAQAAKDGIESFCDAIVESVPKVGTSVASVATSIVTTFKENLPELTFNNLGITLLTALGSGFVAAKPNAMMTIITLCNAMVTQFKISLPETTFRPIGYNTVQWTAYGIESGTPMIVVVIITLCNTIVSTFREGLSSQKFYQIGQDAAMGLKKGIEDKIDEIAQAAIEAAERAVSAARKALKVASPSKIFYQIGQYVSMGLALGIRAMAGRAEKESENMANESVNVAAGILSNIAGLMEDGDFKIELQVVPVMDFEDVEEGIRKVQRQMDYRLDLSNLYDGIHFIPYEVEENRREVREAQDKREKPVQNITNNYDLTQNNYSPKALSQSEIYRQTNNQFSRLKKAVEA